MIPETKHHTSIPAPLPKIDEALRDQLLKAISEPDLQFSGTYDAQAWMMAMSSRLESYVDDEQDRLELLALVRREAIRAGLSPEMVLSVIEVESRFDRFAISRTGAQGMMQVMPFWKEEIGRHDDNLTVTTTNLRYGCTILKYYLQKENGNLRRALADYGGDTANNSYANLVLNAYKKKWKGGEL